MKRHRLIALGFVAALGAGCWSMGSKANSAAASPEQLTETSPAATPTPRPSEPATTANKVTETSKDKPFLANLPADFVQPSDEAGRLLLREYGSVFVARGGASAPKKEVFKDDADVRSFQDSLKRSVEIIGGMKVELQSPAMSALKDAIAEAKASGLSIGPRGPDSSRRGYDQTVTLWASRVNPGLAYWVGKGRVTAADAARIKNLTPFEQVPEILKLEQQGIYFAKDLSKSIIYSVAPPGTSQHMSMLALDVKEFDDPSVRAVLAKHGWYQTVASDLPHFTFLGVPESELPGLGLKRITNSGRTFWVPDL
ncbi:MAG: hypothetical protein ABJA02_14230 [Acidobacteriota bacterium]